MPALTDFTPETLAAQFTQWGHHPAHAARLLRSFYWSNGDCDLAGLRLGKQLQRRVEEEIPLRQSRILARSRSADGTIKLLVGFDAGGAVESVLMPAYGAQRAAGCVSSQMGCAMGCDFCASTRNGLERNLGGGEIAEQFLHLRAEAQSLGRRLSTLVFMGMGEPLHNLDSVIAAIRLIAAPKLGELGWEQVTVSTVGLVPEMDRLADSGLDVRLALSLHAADDATRARLVPLNRRYGVAEVLDATRRYAQRTGTIPTIGYCMLAGINDSDDHARALADRLDGLRAHVNLIPYNSIGTGISGFPFEAASPRRMQVFLAILRERDVFARVRRTQGEDVNAACGQLRETAVGMAVTPAVGTA